MRFIRFVLARRHPDSGVEDGTFGLAYELRVSPQVETATIGGTVTGTEFTPRPAAFSKQV
jgi:hypothetical protein